MESSDSSPMAKVQKSSSDPILVDRLSDLPDPIILYILSFLPTTQVVATCVLSKRWENLWTRTNTLVFESGNQKMDFVCFVNNVLISHDSQCLDKFVLRVGSFVAGYMISWVGFAIARDVRVLDLHFSDPRAEFLILPGKLLTCGTLEFLSLQGKFSVNAPGVVSLPKLTTLKLLEVRFESDESFRKLVSASPVLDSLELIMGCLYYDSVQVYTISSLSLGYLTIRMRTKWLSKTIDSKIEIYAPALQLLHWEDGLSKEYSMTWLASVNEVTLDLATDISESNLVNGIHPQQCDSVVEIIEAMNQVKFLTLKGIVMKGLGNSSTPLSTTFHRLIKLDLWVHCCHWSALKVIVENSPKLEVLNITKLRERFHSCRSKCWSDPKDVPVCLSSSLADISFNGLNGFEDEIAMLRYILEHGAVMRRIYVKTTNPGYSRMDSEKMSEVCQMISTFPRMSSSCQVQFRNS